MTVISLPTLGYQSFFQSQLSLDELEQLSPCRVISVQRDLTLCLGIDEHDKPVTHAIDAYHWREAEGADRPTIGDWLLIDNDGLPVRRLSRSTYLQRRRAGVETGVQSIAANIDTVFIVTSCNEEFSVNRVERYLALISEAGALAVVVLTKTDLCDEIDGYVHAIQESNPLVPVVSVNATDPTCCETLVPWLGRGQTIALLGSSGVGKSTLTNALLGSTAQATGEIRTSDSKGRHTTSSRSLHLLPCGAVLIDTPGMRELQIFDAADGINTTFADITALAAGCRFHDCAHQGEPGCAVSEAVARGELSGRRLDNYHKLLREQAHAEETHAERRRNDKALGRFYKRTLKESNKLKSRDR